MFSLNFITKDQQQRRFIELILIFTAELLAVLVVVAAIAGGSLSVIKGTFARILANTAPAGSTKEEELAVHIKNIRKEIKDLENLRARETWLSPAVADLVARTGPGITLRSFSINRDTNLASITGTAATRDQLLKFEADLNSSVYFKDVAVPLSTLAKPANLDFNLSAALR